MSDWVASYYHVSYVYGFVRRGLVGTFYIPFSHLGVSAKDFALWSTFSASILTAYIFTHLTEDRKIWLLFLFSPATALHLGFDVGRYDHFVLFALALSLFVKRRLWIVPILSVIATLIHEAYVIYALPALTLSLWCRDRKIAILNALLTLLTVLLVVYGGGLDPSLLKLISETNNISLKPLMILSAGTGEVVKTSAHHLISTLSDRPVDVLLPFLLVFAYSAISFPTLKYRALAALSGLFLIPFGYDYPRWAALMINVTLLLLASSGKSLTLSKTLKGLYVLLLLTTFLGPLGAGHYAFPYLEAFLLRRIPY